MHARCFDSGLIFNTTLACLNSMTISKKQKKTEKSDARHISILNLQKKNTAQECHKLSDSSKVASKIKKNSTELGYVIKRTEQNCGQQRDSSTRRHEANKFRSHLFSLLPVSFSQRIHNMCGLACTLF